MVLRTNTVTHLTGPTYPVGTYQPCTRSYTARTPGRTYPVSLPRRYVPGIHPRKIYDRTFYHPQPTTPEATYPAGTYPVDTYPVITYPIAACHGVTYPAGTCPTRTRHPYRTNTRTNLPCRDLPCSPPPWYGRVVLQPTHVRESQVRTGPE